MTTEHLLKIKAEIKNRLREIERSSKLLQADLIESTNHRPNILQDGTTHAQDEGSLNTRLEIHERNMTLRGQLQTALRKIESGAFGKCLMCDEQIESRRLAIHPSATCCVHCQSVEESKPVTRQESVAWINSQDFWSVGFAA